MPSPRKINLKLLIFARYPEPGLTKTRLIPALGPKAAARLQRRMSEGVLQTARQFLRENLAENAGGAVTIRVCFTGANSKKMRAWLGHDLEYQRQAKGDLGRRLTQATALAFKPRLANQSCDGLECGIPRKERRTEDEIEMVMVVGSDLPDLNPAVFHQAVRELRENDLVLGPTTDGGYYLLGLKKPQPELFRNIDWGSELVRNQTLAAAARLNLSCIPLPLLSDVDRPEDLARLQSDPRFTNIFYHPPLLSIIIPTLNEAAALKQTLTHLLRDKMLINMSCRAKVDPPVVSLSSNNHLPPAAIEIIVADGGSQDATLGEIASRAGVRFLTVAGGRAAQLNAGAAEARGVYLFFLHADSQPPIGYPELIHQALGDPATVAGAFRFQTDIDSLALRLIEWGVALSRLGQLPYGDQGLFMEKRVFNEMKGFAPLPIMEDFELIRRLSKRGRVLTLKKPMVTSARRWQRLGLLRTWLINQLVS